jgi:hypothetical protein
MSEVKWPSFVMQGLILATDTSLLLKGGAFENYFIILSMLTILSLFALQTTNDRFIYLFPVAFRNVKLENAQNVTVKLRSTFIDTHILRIMIMLALFFLLAGIYYRNVDVMSVYLFSLLSLAFLVLIPLMFNFWFVPLIEKGLEAKLQKKSEEKKGELEKN